MDDFGMALQRRRSVNPVRKALGNALITLGTGKPQDTSEEDDYIQKLYAQEAIKQRFQDPNERKIKENQAKTGTPEFELKKAQIIANMRGQEALKLEEAKRQAEIDRYNAAMEAEGLGSSQQAPQVVPQTANLTNQTATSIPQKQGQPQQLHPYQTINTREYDPKLGMFIDKPTIKDNPQYKALNDPLSGDAATKFSGATQAKSSVADILKLLQLEPTGSMRDGQPEYRSNIPVWRRVWDKVNQDMAASTGQVFGQNIPGVSDILKAPQYLANERGRITNTEYLTLAEDILRARTGAAAPEPEFVREFARTLNNLGDNPTVVANKLLNNEQFVDEVIESIRPGYLQATGLSRANTGQAQVSGQRQVGRFTVEEA